MGREYLPYGLELLQLVEARVHFVEPDVPVDQPVDRQATLAIEAHEPGNVAHRHARSHIAAAYGLLLSDKIALVWEVADVFRAANERGVALTKSEAIKLLRELHTHHNRQAGLKWEDLTASIEDRVLGRPLTKAEIKRFESGDILTVQK